MPLRRRPSRRRSGDVVHRLLPRAARQCFTTTQAADRGAPRLCAMPSLSARALWRHVDDAWHQRMRAWSAWTHITPHGHGATPCVPAAPSHRRTHLRALSLRATYPLPAGNRSVNTTLYCTVIALYVGGNSDRRTAISSSILPPTDSNRAALPIDSNRAPVAVARRTRLAAPSRSAVRHRTTTRPEFEPPAS